MSADDLEVRWHDENQCLTRRWILERRRAFHICAPSRNQGNRVSRNKACSASDRLKASVGALFSDKVCLIVADGRAAVWVWYQPHARETFSGDPGKPSQTKCGEITVTEASMPLSAYMVQEHEHEHTLPSWDVPYRTLFAWERTVLSVEKPAQ